MDKMLLDSISISSTSSIIEALKKMDYQKRKLLIVLDNGVFKSLLSIGDIQRAIISNVDLSNPIDSILRKKVNVATDKDDKEDIRKYMISQRSEFMPIIDSNRIVVDVLFWKDLFSDDNIQIGNGIISLPVVIMAGGKGTRLQPLTNVLPKPLIPIGKQTIIEDIMDKFISCGCHDFYLSVNYKADVIKRYFDNLEKPNCNVFYFQEDKPLGTAGSLHLLNGKIDTTFFVSNCDIIIDADYREILDYHKSNNNEITTVAAIKNINIPYGTFETREEGLLCGLVEKPTYTLKINTGMYVLEPHLINEIPQNEFYHITYLIDKLVKEKRRVGVFPINDGSWVDIGNWDEYIMYLGKERN